MATRGSVYRRGKTWTAHVKFQRGGKWVQSKEGGFPTRKRADTRLTELLSEIDAGTYVAPSKLTVGGYLDAWLDGLSPVGMRASTITGYRGKVRCYVDDDLRAVRLDDLSAIHLDELYAALSERVSLQTVRHLHRIIHKALADAVRKGLVRRNVAVDATPPRSGAVRPREMRVWTVAELRRFLDATAEHDHAVLFRVAAMTGLRRSELVGLRWVDVDLDLATLAVRQTVAAVDGVPTVEAVKTPRSRRTLDLDRVTLAGLRTHRHAQRERRVLVGPGWRDHDLVFCSPDGRPLHPDVVSKAFARTVGRVDVARIRFHDLRHTHATHLLAAGTNARLVSERLGHTSVAFTLDTYGHVLPGQQADAAAAVAKLVDG